VYYLRCRNICGRVYHAELDGNAGRSRRSSPDLAEVGPQWKPGIQLQRDRRLAEFRPRGLSMAREPNTDIHQNDDDGCRSLHRSELRRIPHDRESRLSTTEL